MLVYDDLPTFLATYRTSTISMHAETAISKDGTGKMYCYSKKVSKTTFENIWITTPWYSPKKWKLLVYCGTDTIDTSSLQKFHLSNHLVKIPLECQITSLKGLEVFNNFQGLDISSPFLDHLDIEIPRVLNDLSITFPLMYSLVGISKKIKSIGHYLKIAGFFTEGGAELITIDRLKVLYVFVVNRRQDLYDDTSTERMVSAMNIIEATFELKNSATTDESLLLRCVSNLIDGGYDEYAITH